MKNTILRLIIVQNYEKKRKQTKKSENFLNPTCILPVFAGKGVCKKYLTI